MSQHSFKLNGEQVLKILQAEFDSAEALREYIVSVMFTRHSTKLDRTDAPVGRPKQVTLPEGTTYSEFAHLREQFKELLQTEPETFRNNQGVKAKDASKDQTTADFSLNQLNLDNGLQITIDDTLGVLVSDN